MRIGRIGRVSLALLALACPTGAKRGGMAPAGPLEPAMLEAEAHADLPMLTLHTTGGRATNPLHTSQISNGAFTEGLTAEVVRSGAFRPVYDAIADYHLHVDLAQIEQPFWGWLDMEVQIGTDWWLCEVETGERGWERRVESAYTATEGDSQWGINRLRIANGDAARENITEGVGALASLAPPAR